MLTRRQTPVIALSSLLLRLITVWIVLSELWFDDTCFTSVWYSKKLVSDVQYGVSSYCLICVAGARSWLQNSMEQFILSVMTQLAICTWLTASQMICIPIVVVLFFVGRILYWIGYLNPTKNRVNRSFGFPLTFIPTTVMIVFCIYKLVTTRLWFMIHRGC